MKHLKNALTLLLALALCLSLAACGDTVDEGDGGVSDIIPTRIDGMVKEDYDDTDYSAYLGDWEAVVNDGEAPQSLYVALNEDGEPRWELYIGDSLEASGYLQIRHEYGDYVYACNEHNGCGYQCWFDSYGALQIQFENTTPFVPAGTVPGWLADGESSGGDYADIAGVWYLDGQPGAASAIEIGADGSWTLYERTDGDGDMTEVDYGTLSAADGEDAVYYAASDAFDDVVYDMTVADTDTMYWGGEYDCYQRTA